MVGERVLVLANSGEREGVFRFGLPDGVWAQVGGRERVDLDGVDGRLPQLYGGAQEVPVPAGSFLVWVLRQ